jgi:hypothetical protein
MPRTKRRMLQFTTGLLGDRESYIDIAADRMGVGADDIGLFHEIFDRLTLQAGHVNSQFDRDAEARAVIARANAHGRADFGFFGRFDLFLARDEFERAEKTSGIAGGEKLLGIGAGATIAAEFAGRGQNHIDLAVRGRAMAFAAPCCTGVSRIEGFYVRSFRNGNWTRV